MVRSLFAFVLFSIACASAQDRSYGRSMVVTPYGIVATSYVQASQAGARILEQDGSAIDAGIAANAVLGVAEPMMNGIGGDLFAIYWEAKTGKLYGLNASGWAPKALTIEHLRAKGITEMPQFGIDSVTVPGVVDWWDGDHDGLLTNPESIRVFLPSGKVPATGEVFRNSDVAHALRLVAEQGE